jgi:hypothetical protein
MAHSHPLSPAGTTFALLDANVLLPPRLSDVIFDLAGAGLFSARWTEMIEAEFLRNWLAVVDKAGRTGTRRPVGLRQSSSSKALKRLECYRSAVRDFEIYGVEEEFVTAQVPDAVDLGDRHVAAAAIVLLNYANRSGSADKVFIVSANIKHLAAKEMHAMGIEVVSPGKFIDLLFLADKWTVETALGRTLADLRKPPYTRACLLDALALHGAKETVLHLATMWNVVPSSMDRR